MNSQAVVHGLQPSDDVYTSARHLLPDANNRWQSSGTLHVSGNVNNLMVHQCVLELSHMVEGASLSSCITPSQTISHFFLSGDSYMQRGQLVIRSWNTTKLNTNNVPYLRNLTL